MQDTNLLEGKSILVVDDDEPDVLEELLLVPVSHKIYPNIKSKHND